MTSFDPSAYGRRVSDGYDDSTRWLGDPTPTVDVLAELAGGGAVLEFGIGTGRLALPLAARGIPVAGIDGSAEMVDLLRRKPGGADIPVSVGDFAATRVEGRFAVVVLAFNTVFALPDQRAQVRCFRNAADHLAPGGRFVVEAWVPDPGAFRGGRSVQLVTAGVDEVQLQAAELFPAEQLMRTVKVRLTDGGVRLLPATHRYAWPAELDLMAELAGLRREDRWADWTGAPFADTSTGHVSVYRAP